MVSSTLAPQKKLHGSGPVMVLHAPCKFFRCFLFSFLYCTLLSLLVDGCLSFSIKHPWLLIFSHLSILYLFILCSQWYLPPNVLLHCFVSRALIFSFSLEFILTITFCCFQDYNQVFFLCCVLPILCSTSLFPQE